MAKKLDREMADLLSVTVRPYVYDRLADQGHRDRMMSEPIKVTDFADRACLEDVSFTIAVYVKTDALGCVEAVIPGTFDNIRAISGLPKEERARYAVGGHVTLDLSEAEHITEETEDLDDDDYSSMYKIIEAYISDTFDFLNEPQENYNASYVR